MNCMKAAFKALVICLPLAACAKPGAIIKEVPIEVKVPVTTPCVVERPIEPMPLRDQLSRDEWESLTTDQRQAILAAQAIGRKIFSDRLLDATAACQDAG